LLPSPPSSASTARGAGHLAAQLRLDGGEHDREEHDGREHNGEEHDGGEHRRGAGHCLNGAEEPATSTPSSASTAASTTTRSWPPPRLVTCKLCTKQVDGASTTAKSWLRL